VTRDRRPVVIDADPGIDDVLAILYLTGLPDVEIVGLTTVHGNVPAGTGARNALKAFEIAGAPDVPVVVGIDRPLVHQAATAEDVHGTDGLGDAGVLPSLRRPSAGSGPVQLLQWARERPGEITLLAIGPLTNVAVAQLLEPKLPSLFRELVIMGGAVWAPGNVTPHAEFNTWHDPEAARVVLEAPWNMTLVGLDVTARTRLEGAALAELEGSPKPVARFASAILQGYLKESERESGVRAAFMHDPLASAIMMDPRLADFRDTPLLVELAEPERGRTRPEASGGGPAVHVAVDVDGPRFIARYLSAVLR
jgi:purine nucleosidase